MASADLTHELTCPICLEMFIDPVSLECGHHFCRSCISRSWEKVPGDVSCPQCRQVFAQRNTRPARTLGNIAEQLRLLKVKATQREEEFYCEEHGERLKMFCEEEQKVICVDCWSSEHQTHNDLHIKEATQKYQEKLEKSLEFLQKQMDLAVQCKREGEDRIAQIKAQVNTLRRETSTEFEKMHKFLSEKEELMKAELEQKADKILEEMENNLKSTFDEISSLEGAIRDLKARLEIQEAPELLKDIDALLTRCEIEVHNPGAVSAELPADIVGGPLKYVKVWREMRAVISPVPVPLTLDPKTAHPRLTLSDNRTRVTGNNKEQLVSDNPKRFNYWQCVLGSEGYTSGRHYWEVEVGNNIFWVVGLAKESMPRKEKFTLDNISGFWAMAMSQGQYKALTSPRTILSLRTKPRKLGVYLNYEGGQVSLYNADDVSPLYTFTDTFTEKLYPVLMANSGESLTLLPSQR